MIDRDEIRERMEFDNSLEFSTDRREKAETYFKEVCRRRALVDACEVISIDFKWNSISTAYAFVEFGEPDPDGIRWLDFAQIRLDDWCFVDFSSGEDETIESARREMISFMTLASFDIPVLRDLIERLADDNLT